MNNQKHKNHLRLKLRLTYLLRLLIIMVMFSCQPTSKKSAHKVGASKGIPMVISTWNNQIANEIALKTMIQDKGSSLDAIEHGIRSVEANPDDMSVGYGGRPDRSGEVTLDACIMNAAGNCGAVTYLKGIKHPISVARAVMENTPHVILTGAGAQEFALNQGFEFENLLTDKSIKEYDQWLIKSEYKPKANIENHDTIGQLAIDREGNISGGCSTSGLAYKMKGRVGDSPIIGAGLYVDNEIGAAVATGLGEEILKMVGSFLIVELMRNGHSPQKACEIAVERYAKKVDGNDVQIAFVAMDREGTYGGYSLLPGFEYAVSQDGDNQLVKAPSYMD